MLVLFLVCYVCYGRYYLRTIMKKGYEFTKRFEKEVGLKIMDVTMYIKNKLTAINMRQIY